jgi:hypothetical protein
MKGCECGSHSNIVNKSAKEKAEKELREKVSLLGGECLFSEYEGARKGHKISCPKGHIVYPHPATIRAIKIEDLDNPPSFCKICMWSSDRKKKSNRFYVVVSNKQVKIGITSSENYKRLQVHKRDGFEIRAIWSNLEKSQAGIFEAFLIRVLKEAGWNSPGFKREYFDIGALGLVLELAESHLGEPDK